MVRSKTETNQMKHGYCEFCFKTILHTGIDRAVRCISCGKVYHEEHYEEVCSHCSETKTEVYVPTSGTVVRNITRRPLRLKRVDFDTVRWGAVEYADWITSLFQAIINALLGIVVSTVVGSYMFRLLSYQTYTDPIEYLNNIIRNGFPPQSIILIALMASVLGAFVFFPSKLPNGIKKHDSSRRFGRFVAIIILFIGINLDLFGLDAKDIMGILKSELQLSTGAYGLSFFAAQGGALVTTMLVGYVVRASNESVYRWEFPKYMRRTFRIFNVLWFYIASLVTIVLAFLLSLGILPSYRLELISIQVGERNVRTNYAYLVALIATVFVALLVYHPPVHSAAERRWWFFRFIGGVIALVGVGNYYRMASSSQLEVVAQAALIAGITTVCFVPVQRAIS